MSARLPLPVPAPTDKFITIYGDHGPTEREMADDYYTRTEMEEYAMANVSAFEDVIEARRVDARTPAHTPGPWNIHVATDKREYACDGWTFRTIYLGAGEKLIAELARYTYENPKNGGFPRVDNDAENEANARLIASAPELLDSLRALLADDGRDTPVLNAARAVVAKAMGGAA